ncbi:MAG TPA: DUF819 family protein [Chitinophagaceae bacterium]|jgi:uncharacterized membrane protein|nr:DUF819 family protein [Chitinophagaceae bacterium]
MSFIQQPLYILTVLLLLILFSEWLAERKFFKHIGSVLLVIILAAISANLNIIPSSTNAPPLYDGIFHYAAPLGIFFLMLQVKLRELKLAGLPMIMMFLIGSATTIAGVIIGYEILSPQRHGIHLSYAVAGMYTGTYIGGSANLNAVAVAYGVNKDGTQFAAINAADNIITGVWMMMTLILPSIFQRYFPRKRRIAAQFENLSDEELRTRMLQPANNIRLKDITLLLALGFGTMFISEQITNYFNAVPSILVITTLALVFAQLPFVQRLQGTKLIGFGLVMLFLAVVGAYCDINALIRNGSVAATLLMWVVLIVFIHGALIFLTGGFLKQDWDIVSIASNANIGGATSAPVCANSIGRPDLQLPGLLAGTIGNAIGTYLGVFVAEILK